MTDTDFYPPPPRPGSNAIGSFVIGTSPIGTIDFVWQDTVLSQYANSARIISIVASFADAVGMVGEFDDFFSDLWDISTAEDAGLDNWGRILNIGRVLTVDAGTYLGFEEALPGSEAFGQQPFYAGPPASGNYSLSTEAYRLLLLAKAAFNICDGTIPAINQLLLNLFPGRGNAYVQDGFGPESDEYFGFEEAGGVDAAPFGFAPFYSGEGLGRMSLIYVFEFLLTPVELAIVEQSGVLPQPTGVAVNVLII